MPGDTQDPDAAPGPAAQGQQGPFSPHVPEATTPGVGPPWMGGLPGESLRRIRASTTVEEAGVQAATETVILLHSIRRTLIWALIVIPLLAVGLWITMIAIANGSEPASCTSAYSCR